MSIVPAHHLQLSDAQHALLMGLMAQHVPHLQVWAFGSRVKGTARASSDLDVVFFATEADKPKLTLLREALEESLLPCAVDMLVWQDISPDFQQHIQAQYQVLQASTPLKVDA
jgi:predicted nucleotidyltransferase